MTLFWLILALFLCIAASAIYSGSETALYSLSKVQLDLEAERGNRSARLTRWLSRDDAGLLILILIGNNLALELATHVGESLGLLLGLSATVATFAVSIWLTPIAFLLAEVLPKEVFRRRPHGLVPLALPLLLISKVVFWPLERVLRVVAYLFERLFGLKGNSVAVLRGRDRWHARFEEGRRAGAIPEKTYKLVHNAMALHSTALSNVMVPWENVVVVKAEGSDEERLEQVRSSRFSRLPIVDAQGHVTGYLHQLDVLARAIGLPARTGFRALENDPDSDSGDLDVLEGSLDAPFLEPECTIAGALLQLRGSGKRAAVVGTSEKPLGWVTLKDLVEELSGDLVGL
ncbi:MAG: CNNM domain-containing protein [Planctomycetota bacterium]|nr:CNNM domain-containing protein [Planctomycetota bacterium]